MKNIITMLQRILEWMMTISGIRMLKIINKTINKINFKIRIINQHIKDGEIQILRVIMIISSKLHKDLIIMKKMIKHKKIFLIKNQNQDLIMMIVIKKMLMFDE